MATMQKISSCLWFDNQAEEAVNFYISIFKDSRVGKVSRYGKQGFEQHHMPEGTIMTVEFWLDGQKFLALNGGPVFRFNEAVSFVVNCESQEEVNYYWDKLSEGGDPNAQMCGWLKDKFGLSWQVVPTAMSELMSSPDREKAGRTMNAMLKMKKLDLPALRRAFEGEEEAVA
jgi:predicted 3-demethylubiquinone-9 3-methyltransferase (glyoxalase superfamily)